MNSSAFLPEGEPDWVERFTAWWWKVLRRVPAEVLDEHAADVPQAVVAD